MRTSVVLLLISVFGCTTSGQEPASSQPAPNIKSIAVASIHVDKHRFKSGERIEVTILLEAGPNGVYVPKWWGRSDGGIRRWQELTTSPDHHEEGSEMEVASAALLRIKTHKLGWPAFDGQ